MKLEPFLINPSITLLSPVKIILVGISDVDRGEEVIGVTGSGFLLSRSNSA
ncbi:hypothetical protein D3C73_1545000 [compost metagenome]